MGTTKSITFNCDRCDATTGPFSEDEARTPIERSDWRFIIHGYVETIGLRVLLCPRCYAAFEVFMKGTLPFVPPAPAVGGEVSYAHR